MTLKPNSKPLPGDCDIVTDSGSRYALRGDRLTRLSEIPVIHGSTGENIYRPLKEWQVIGVWVNIVPGNPLVLTLLDENDENFPLRSTPVKEMIPVAS